MKKASLSTFLLASAVLVYAQQTDTSRIPTGQGSNKNKTAQPDTSRGITDPGRGKNTFVIYPQPADRIFKIRFNDKIDRIRVTNMIGQDVIDLSGLAANKKRYNVSWIPSGTYQVFIESKDQYYRQNMLVQH